jgi:RecQ-mediated genome instability protein 1
LTPIMVSLSSELITHLSIRHLHPTTGWLTTFLTTIRPTTPLPALKQTALFRLLATDITTTLSPPPETVFPRDVLNAKIQSRWVVGPVVCQVMDVEDIGHSRWSQVETIEAKERGETTKGREVIRVIQDADAQPDVQADVDGKGPFKLLLQDAKGVKVYAFDLRGMQGVNMAMAMGVKVLLRNVEVRRGVVMLEPGGVQLLGGKIEGLDKSWKDGRKERLIAAANSGRQPMAAR